MAEAQKMMNNPEYQKKMKELTKDKAFQDSMKHVGDMMKDPTKAAEAEAKMEHMLKVGENQLKQKAGDQMKEAMAAMSNPEVMAEVQKMMKDPAGHDRLSMGELVEVLFDSGHFFHVGRGIVFCVD